MFRRLISAAGQSRSAKTVEVFGWLILFQGTIVLFAPHFAFRCLGIESLTPQATNYFRLSWPSRVGARHALYRQRPLERARICFRFHASTGQSFPLPWRSFGFLRSSLDARSDIFNSRLRQLSLDTVQLACRTAKNRRGEFL